MAATGKTPILLYGSTTATNAPSAGNLTNSSDGCEIAINVADKNLFFKDSTNAVNTVPIRQSSASSNGWLSSTDWSTFNGKQPAGTYVTSVTGTAPVVSSGGTTPAISMAAATGSVNGYLTSTDWTTFNNKVSSQWTTSGSSVYYSAGTVGVYSTNFSGAALTIGQNSSDFTLGTNYATYIVGNGYAGAMALNATSFQIGQNSASRNLTLHSGTSWAEQVRIGPTGNVTLQNGNLVIGTSGKGIDFSAVVHSGSTGKLLADYEEGTWSPTYVPASGAFGSIVYAFQYGNYVKVGKMVTVSGQFRITSLTVGTASGTLFIGGLPFTSYSGNGGYSVAIGYAASFASNTPLAGYLANNATTFTLNYRSAVTSQSTANTVADLATTANTNYIWFSVTYETA